MELGSAGSERYRGFACQCNFSEKIRRVCGTWKADSVQKTLCSTGNGLQAVNMNFAFLTFAMGEGKWHVATFFSFRSLASKGIPSGYIFEKCVCLPALRKLRTCVLISQMTPDEHPPTPPPCRGPGLITLPTLAKFEHTLTAVCVLPEHQSVVNMMCIQTFCGHLNILYIFDQTDLHRFEVRLELSDANARLVASPPLVSPSHPPTPPSNQ